MRSSWLASAMNRRMRSSERCAACSDSSWAWKAVSIWLKADFDVLYRRIKRRTDRPLLKGQDPAQILKRLLAEREPIYAQADATILSRDVAHDVIVDEIIALLAARLAASDPSAAAIGGINACDRCR